jgi:hypothetical protein
MGIRHTQAIPCISGLGHLVGTAIYKKQRRLQQAPHLLSATLSLAGRPSLLLIPSNLRKRYGQAAFWHQYLHILEAVTFSAICRNVASIIVGLRPSSEIPTSIMHGRWFDLTLTRLCQGTLAVLAVDLGFHEATRGTLAYYSPTVYIIAEFLTQVKIVFMLSDSLVWFS